MIVLPPHGAAGAALHEQEGPDREGDDRGDTNVRCPCAVIMPCARALQLFLAHTIFHQNPHCVTILSKGGLMADRQGAATSCRLFTKYKPGISAPVTANTLAVFFNVRILCHSVALYTLRDRLWMVEGLPFPLDFAHFLVLDEVGSAQTNHARTQFSVSNLRSFWLYGLLHRSSLDSPPALSQTVNEEIGPGGVGYAEIRRIKIQDDPEPFW